MHDFPSYLEADKASAASQDMGGIHIPPEGNLPAPFDDSEGNIWEQHDYEDPCDPEELCDANAEQGPPDPGLGTIGGMLPLGETLGNRPFDSACFPISRADLGSKGFGTGFISPPMQTVNKGNAGILYAAEAGDSDSDSCFVAFGYHKPRCSK